MNDIINKSWENLEKVLGEYNKLEIEKAIDFEKFNLYSLVHHSTTIEGNTLTEGETITLLDKGLTAQGKPLEHSLMVQDCYKALLFVKGKSKEKTLITSDLLKNINELVCKKTGQLMNTPLGVVDGTKGEFRKSASHAQGGGYYLSHEKIPKEIENLCMELNEKLKKTKSIQEKYKLSFDAHYNLVTIHPWIDGNGRTARLLMNYIQLYCDVPMTKVYLSDRQSYIDALQETRKNSEINIFRNFMINQQIKFFSEKINEYQQYKIKEKNAGFNLLF